MQCVSYVKWQYRPIKSQKPISLLTYVCSAFQQRHLTTLLCNTGAFSHTYTHTRIYVYIYILIHKHIAVDIPTYQLYRVLAGYLGPF